MAAAATRRATAAVPQYVGIMWPCCFHLRLGLDKNSLQEWASRMRGKNKLAVGQPHSPSLWNMTSWEIKIRMTKHVSARMTLTGAKQAAISIMATTYISILWKHSLLLWFESWESEENMFLFSSSFQMELVWLLSILLALKTKTGPN